MISYILRAMEPDDTSFILNSWMKSYKEHSSYTWSPDRVFFPGMEQIIKFLFTTSEVVVACYPEEPSEIIAWLTYQFVGETMVLHYIYVKNLYRHQGIAKQILTTLTPNIDLIMVTHITDDYITLRHKMKPKKILFDPFFIQNQRLLK